jgi:acetylglutamate kinase
LLRQPFAILAKKPQTIAFGRFRYYETVHCYQESDLEDAIKKADTLLEALGWIRRFRDTVTVVKLGGSVLDVPDMLRHILLDVLFMESVGMRPVIVHGGGKRISKAMDEAGIKPTFIQGRRYTDQATLEIVERVLATETNQYIAEMLESLGGRAMTLNFASTNVLFGEQINLTDDDGQAIDLGFVGNVTRVDRVVIDNLCYAKQVPIIPSMCETESGQKLNVNADTAATAVAQALGAEKLVLLSDVPGVMRDRDDAESLLKTLTAEEAKELIAAGVIEAGMIPKVESCLETLQRGVSKIHIIDGRIRHSLLLEIYTTEGIGTQIVAS